MENDVNTLYEEKKHLVGHLVENDVDTLYEERNYLVKFSFIRVYDMIWYDMIWYDMIWYDMIWYDMIWYPLFDTDLLWDKNTTEWLADSAERNRCN